MLPTTTPNDRPSPSSSSPPTRSSSSSGCPSMPLRASSPSRASMPPSPWPCTPRGDTSVRTYAFHVGFHTPTPPPHAHTHTHTQRNAARSLTFPGAGPMILRALESEYAAQTGRRLEHCALRVKVFVVFMMCRRGLYLSFFKGRVGGRGGSSLSSPLPTCRRSTLWLLNQPTQHTHIHTPLGRNGPRTSASSSSSPPQGGNGCPTPG